MPKVRPLGNEVMKTARELDSQNWTAEDSRISEALRDLHCKSRKTHAELAYMLGMNLRTWHARIAFPSTLKLPEMRKLIALGKRYGVDIQFLEEKIA